MSRFPFHVAGGVFGGGRVAFAEALALPAAANPARSVQGSRRRKLWELPHKFHCPLIGVCFDCDELRRVMFKVMHLPRDATDFVLHTTAVGCCETRGPLVDILQKTLEKRFRNTLAQFAIIKDEAGLRLRWRKACIAREQLPAILWTCWTHPACSEPLAQEIYGDIHMIQHQLGAQARLDQAVIDAIVQENIDLRERHEIAKGALEALRQSHALEIESARRKSAQSSSMLAAVQARMSDQERELRRLQALAELPTRQALQQRLADAESKGQEAREQLETLSRELTRLREFARHAEETIEALSREDDLLTALPDRNLNGKCVLCVGGRSGAINAYRDVVESSGGHFLHHDGGLEERLQRIDGVVAAADIVICQAGCISHNAYWRVKELCKRTGKPCMFVKSAGISSFGRTVGEIGKKG